MGTEESMQMKHFTVQSSQAARGTNKNKEGCVDQVPNETSKRVHLTHSPPAFPPSTSSTNCSLPTREDSLPRCKKRGSGLTVASDCER
eukprot:m.143222 g.143222  ORF g.143222 m.143222 type:complete len:88 (+) comp14084_c0_seq5:310-573(+)